MVIASISARADAVAGAAAAGKPERLLRLQTREAPGFAGLFYLERRFPTQAR